MLETAMTPAHATMVRLETIVSTAINAIVPTAIIAALGVAPPATLFGDDDGLIRGLVPGTGVATLLMTLVVTALVRARMRRGIVPPVAPASLPGLAAMLPRSLILRAVVMALAAVVVLVPFWCAAVTILSLLPLDRTEQIVFNLALGVSVGVAMTPWVVLRAFGDGATA